MLGSGMNSAAVAWYILQATHSEIALGTFAVLQTLPAMLMLPFTGVLIDREDRRRLVMVLDIARGVIILTVAILAFAHRVKLWEVYLMNTLVAAGFWMFWPTITALIQELTPGEEFIDADATAGMPGHGASRARLHHWQRTRTVRRAFHDSRHKPPHSIANNCPADSVADWRRPLKSPDHSVQDRVEFAAESAAHVVDAERRRSAVPVRAGRHQGTAECAAQRGGGRVRSDAQGDARMASGNP